MVKKSVSNETKQQVGSVINRLMRCAQGSSRVTTHIFLFHVVFFKALLLGRRSVRCRTYLLAMMISKSHKIVFLKHAPFLSG